MTVDGESRINSINLIFAKEQADDLVEKFQEAYDDARQLFFVPPIRFSIAARVTPSSFRRKNERTISVADGRRQPRKKDESSKIPKAAEFRSATSCAIRNSACTSFVLLAFTVIQRIRDT